MNPKPAENILLQQNPDLSHREQSNNLFPIFVKLENLRLLIIGAGNIGAEKLETVFLNSPQTRVRVVALVASHKVIELCKINSASLFLKPYEKGDLENIDIVIAATGDKNLAAKIREDCQAKGILINVADTPDLCDFYLGAVVKKGDLKIAISTNGKSPTIAKRIKETLQESMPDSLQSVMENMNRIRLSLNGDFKSKVEHLNKISSVLNPLSDVSEPFAEKLIIPSNLVSIPISFEAPSNSASEAPSNSAYEALSDSANEAPSNSEKKSRINNLPREFSRYVWWLGFAMFFTVLGGLVFRIPALAALAAAAVRMAHQLDTRFYWMIVTGFGAQIIAGALGMGYGVLCTTILLSLGINLPAISSSIHTAETFASGISGFSHYKFGNVDIKLLKSLLLPGIAGAIVGAVILSLFGDKYAAYIRPVLALYTLFLGAKILLNAFQKKILKAKIMSIPLLATAGGFIDSFGGGGWGPLVTSSFIAQGRNPRMVVGTVSLGKFFVSAASAITFFAMLGISSQWQIIAGLLIGGITAAPLSARLAGLLPNRLMFISVGILVILCSLRLLFKSFF